MQRCFVTITGCFLFACSASTEEPSTKPADASGITSTPAISPKPSESKSRHRPTDDEAAVLLKSDISVLENQHRPTATPHVPPRATWLDREDIVAVSLLSRRSLSMKIRLKGERFKVFKPVLKDDRRAQYEVAAFLIAKRLGIDGIPPSVMGTLPLALLQNRLAKDSETIANRLAAEALLDNRRKVLGAQIDWVTDLDPDGVEKHGGLSTLKKWLYPARPVGTYEPMLAVSLSNVVVFDYLIGNWDRFSGGNLFINLNSDKLVLLDHNAAFGKWGAPRRKRMKKRLSRTERFSKSFIEKIRQLTEDDIERALRKDPSHRKNPLLSPKQISRILERRDELIAHVNQLVQLKGSENVLVFD